MLICYCGRTNTTMVICTQAGSQPHQQHATTSSSPIIHMYSRSLLFYRFSPYGPSFFWQTIINNVGYFLCVFFRIWPAHPNLLSLIIQTLSCSPHSSLISPVGFLLQMSSSTVGRCLSVSNDSEIWLVQTALYLKNVLKI